VTERAKKAEAEVERLRDIVKAQQDELEAISCALGTNEGHSSVDHIVQLRNEIAKLNEAR
jgi:CHASE3 domain sensor protein